MGRGQAAAVFHTARYCNKQGIPTIADGGVQNSGHIVKVRMPPLALWLCLLWHPCPPVVYSCWAGRPACLRACPS